MKRLLSLMLMLGSILPAYAHHIIGGEMYYVSHGKTGDGYRYQIVLKLYRGCEPVDNDHAALDEVVTFGVYNNDDSTLFTYINNIVLQGPRQSNKQRYDSCIINPPTVCYQIGTYSASITLPENKNGYTIIFQRCCRNDLLLNVYTQSNVGASYFTEIPGTDNGIPGDNSPVFTQDEAVLICSKGRLQYSYAASDPDGQDSLAYSFHPGYVGGSRGDAIPQPAAPPYSTFVYRQGFDALHPLGPDVHIDPHTGMISGRTNLEPGSYDVCVAVMSYRNGKLLGTHLKDFQVDVHNCNRVVLADIPTLFNDCRSPEIHFPNHSTQDKTYVWDFGDGTTSSEYTPTHTYRDTGTYHVWIKVDPKSSCGDSMEADVRVYPGLQADFKASGNCLQFPTEFHNISLTADYDSVTALNWDFGGPGTYGDTSDMNHPQYQYSQAGDYAVHLQVTTAMGCVQSDTQQLTVYEAPPMNLTPDTILCYGDALQLHAEAIPGGHYQWAPTYDMDNPSIESPTVSPLLDTTYRVTFTDDRGCYSMDSVHLRIKKILLVNAGVDTVICRGDPLLLRGAADEDYAFSWFDPSGALIGQDSSLDVTPEAGGTYRVQVTLGTCSAEDEMQAKLVPYPQASAAPDTSICYGDEIRLQGTGGAFYSWSPGPSLDDSLSHDPLARPLVSTRYTLTVRDTLGCPKPDSQSVFVNVVPPIVPFAGNDTIITIGQTFQLHATGANTYAWTPPFGLSDPSIADPIVQWNQDITYQVRVTHEPEGCYALDTIHVRYIKGPAIYVPTAFSPNGDGQNDVFRPIPVGITQIRYFEVFNRWGQRVYQTTQYMQGWNGFFNGKPAPVGAYVWMVRGEDYTGKTIVEKGTVTLIR